MTKLRAALALLTLALFPVVVLALLAGLVLLGVRVASVSGTAGVKIIGWLALPLVFAVGYAVRDVLRARPEPLQGPELSRAEHPALWAEIDSLAKGLDTPAPVRVVVDPTVNAAVTQVRGEREMLIGLPLLAGMSVPELRSVLAHELGHYGAGHTRLTALTYRFTDTVLATVANTSGIVRWLLMGYARLYVAVASASNRDQENEADAYSAEVCGPSTAARALRHLVELDVAWDTLLEGYLPLASAAGRRPRLAAGLREVLAARADEVGRAVHHIVANPQKGSWADSHPPIGRRIAGFERLAGTADVGPRGAAAASEAPAWTLLGNHQGSLDALERDLLVTDDEVADWDEIVDRAGTAVTREAAGALTRAAEQTGEASPATLENMLAAVQSGRGGALVAPLANPALPASQRPEAERLVLTEHLGAAVLDALITAGRARYVLDWSGPWRVVSVPGQEPLEVEALVAPAVADPAAVPALRAELQRLGVPLGHGATAAEEPEPVSVGVLTHVKGPDKDVVDVLVCDTGVLLLPAQRAGRVATGLRQMTAGAARAEDARLEQQLDGNLGELRSRPGARWIDTEEIRAGKLGRRPWGWTLQLRLTDGSEFSMRSTTDTDERGEGYEGLGRLLGTRMSDEAWEQPV